MGPHPPTKRAPTTGRETSNRDPLGPGPITGSALETFHPWTCDPAPSEVRGSGVRVLPSNAAGDGECLVILLVDGNLTARHLICARPSWHGTEGPDAPPRVGERLYRPWCNRRGVGVRRRLRGRVTPDGRSTRRTRYSRRLKTGLRKSTLRLWIRYLTCLRVPHPRNCEERLRHPNKTTEIQRPKTPFRNAIGV